MKRIIISAEITAMPRPIPEGMFDPMPKVEVKLSTGETATLFQYFPDELSFTADEFLGLTLEEGKALKFKKDRNFLRS